MNKKLLSIAILGTMTFSSLILPTTASAESYTDKIEEAKQNANQNQKNIDETDQKIKGLASEKDNTQGQLENINNTIRVNKEKSQKLVADIQKSQKEMDSLQSEITTLEEKIEQRNEQLDQQARTVQTNGDTQNYIEFIIEAESLVDVLGRVDVVSQMVNANKTLVEEQVADQKLVVEKKTKTEQTIVQQNALAAQLEDAQTSLEQQLLEKEVIVSQLASEMATAQEDKDAFLAQKAAAESAVAEYTSAQEAAEKAVQVAFEQKKAEEAEAAEKVENEAASESVSATSSSEQNNTETAAAEAATPAASTSQASQSSSESSESNQTANNNTSSSHSSSTSSSTKPATSKPAADSTPAKKPAPTPAPAPSSGGTSLSAMQPAINAALAAGKPYLWGGTSLSGGFDCSGFTQYVFNNVGVSIPRVASAQYSASTHVSNPQPGDLVFFSLGGSTVDHVGIVTGGGGFIGSQSSTGVAYTSYTSGWWANKVVGFGRY
ncbi:C40 family peptidase [Carnobacterium mobile]|uniref:C40 family peptidase n=1 Tax=Carnobacterium mobile TaxID=2750 RepID=UPI0005503304|nr:C40 family peptidase [Carnobacterium mobile]